MARQVVTAEDRRQQMAKAGLRPSIDGLQRVFDINPGKVISNHFETQDALDKQKAKARAKRQKLEAEKRGAHRAMLADDTEAVVAAARQGNAPALGSNPLVKIEADLEEVGRVLSAIDVAERTTAVEITLELTRSGYLGKVAKAYEAERRWQPKPNTPYSRIKQHEGALDEFIVYATPILLAVEIATNGEMTNKEMSELRKALQAKPARFPSVAGIREVTRSRIAETPLAKDIERRAAQKQAQSKIDQEEAAESARHRLGAEHAKNVTHGEAPEVEPEKAEPLQAQDVKPEAVDMSAAVQAAKERASAMAAEQEQKVSA